MSAGRTAKPRATGEDLKEASTGVSWWQSYGDVTALIYRMYYSLTDAKAEARKLRAELKVANTIIAEARAQTKRGNLATPPWVIAALNGKSAS